MGTDYKITAIKREETNSGSLGTISQGAPKLLTSFATRGLFDACIVPVNQRKQQEVV